MTTHFLDARVSGNIMAANTAAMTHSKAVSVHGGE